jgi:ABC-type uncharacterized transport system fused permease/ATPase subunit
MQDYPQGPAVGQQPAGQQQGRRLQGALDPRSYDPRKVVDQQHLREQAQRLARAQAVARARAQATSTVFLATVVSLATSAFGVVAALAWNQAIQDSLADLQRSSLIAHLTKAQRELVYALIVTFIAVVIILTLNRIASRIARKSAIDAAEADAGNV